MICIKKYSKLKISNILLLFVCFNLVGCSGTQVFSSGAGVLIASNQDEKTFGDVIDDTTISIGIKDKFFMHNAILITKINVDVELGTVLLTGRVNEQNDRVQAVRLAWQQEGVVSVLNEIEIESFDIKKYAEDKLIKTKLLAKVISDNKIKKLKYTFEVQNKVIFIMGVSSDDIELNRVFEHARSIKGVRDIINYVVITAPTGDDAL
jgi:osmotically-inducible protein OsmY|tara:strand:+ start:287 stop:907 length:621 start_codon:yes stop_codon:yes gene_type:complete